MGGLFEFEFGLIFWQTVILLTAMFVLRKYAWRTILESIQKQEDAYLQADKHIESAQKITQQLQGQSKEILARAHARSEQILQTALATKEALLEEAKIEALHTKEAFLTKAQKSIAEEKEKALETFKKQMALLVVKTTEKLLARELSEKNKQEALLKMLIAEADTKYSTAA